MANLINTGVSALRVFQQALNTTGHNIANVNTDGYSRQRVDTAATRPDRYGTVGYIGTGVNPTAVRRSYDQFLVGQVRNYNAQQAEYRTFHVNASRVDELIADSGAGLDRLMQQFFEATSDVASDPSSVPARQVMLDRGDALVDRFHALSDWIADVRGETNSAMSTFVGSVNDLTGSIAQYNREIRQTSGNDALHAPNDLLDQRDQLIDQLSHHLAVTTSVQADGSINVYFGSGQALVLADRTFELSVGDKPESSDIKLIELDVGGGSTIDISDLISGGRLNGIRRFQSEVLDVVENRLGLVATGLGHFFNAEHQSGLDLAGELGQNFFAISQPQVLDRPGNSSSLTASFDDVSKLTGLEYELRFDAGSWNLTRTDTDAIVAMSGSGTGADPFLFDGLSLVVSGVAGAGDFYRLRPTRAGAAEIDTLLADPRNIAAADVVVTEAIAANTGTGVIGLGALVDRTGSTKLAAPVTLAFDSANNWFDISTGGTLAYDPSTDSGSELTLTLAGLGDFSFTMQGIPANGDQFALQDNTGASGDNRNALRLADLRTQALMLNGSSTVHDTHSVMVADVGAKTSLAQTNMEVRQELLEQAEKARDEVSGVNLDEEAADLIRFQQAYQASARVVATANTLFDSILAVVGR
jgi:flagellar hook-associated protein 1 FlgK